MDLPKTIQLDFLLTILGVLFVGFPVYLIFFKEYSNLLGLSFLLLFVISGLLFFMIGINEMNNNYEREKKLLEIETKEKYLDCLVKINEHEKRLNKK